MARLSSLLLCRPRCMMVTNRGCVGCEARGETCNETMSVERNNGGRPTDRTNQPTNERTNERTNE
jgi:hypothetical protein